MFIDVAASYIHDSQLLPCLLNRLKASHREQIRVAIMLLIARNLRRLVRAKISYYYPPPTQEEIGAHRNINHFIGGLLKELLAGSAGFVDENHIKARLILPVYPFFKLRPPSL